MAESTQNLGRTMSMPGTGLQHKDIKVNMSVSGASFNMAGALNTGYPMFQGAGGFGLDVMSSNDNVLESRKTLNNYNIAPLASAKSHGSRPNQKSFKKMLGRAIEREIANE